MAVFSVRVTTSKTVPVVSTGDKQATFNNLMEQLPAITQIGTFGNGSTLLFETAEAYASGTLTVAAPVLSSTIGGIINGVTITITSTGDAEDDAALISAAINASSNALVAKQVTTTVAGAVVTVTALNAGFAGNAVTLAASGATVTASGARLTGGTATQTSFTY